MSNEFKKIYSDLVVANKNKRSRLQGKVQTSIPPKNLAERRFTTIPRKKNCTSQEHSRHLFKRVFDESTVEKENQPPNCSSGVFSMVSNTSAVGQSKE